jgi:DNA-binding transcriptional MerR regulator
MYRIGQFAAFSRVSVKTLRYYDQIGLLRPAVVEPRTSYRFYAAWQIEQVNRILALKDAGLSLRDIRALVADRASRHDIATVLRSRHEELERKMASDCARFARGAARLDALTHAGGQYACDMTLRTVPGCRIVAVRRTIVSHDDSNELLDELRHGMRGRSRGVPYGATWHQCRPRSIDCEVWAVDTGGSELGRRLRLRHIPAQQVVSLVYRGEEFTTAYGALRSWMAASGLRGYGAKREVYLQAAGADREAVTEVQVPVHGRGDA